MPPRPSPSLADLATTWRAHAGLVGKRDIAKTVAGLGLGGDSPIPVGDDCAAIPDGGGWQLLACEGMQNEFVAAMPWFAGWSAVMVNLSDIAAMGGRPTALVDAIWARDADRAGPILEGMRAAAAHYGVPIVGGHANLRSDREQLSVAVLGRARRLITSFDARPGDVLVAAIDLRGRDHAPHPFWDAATEAPIGRQRADMDVLADIAEAGLCSAGKDISQGGVIGTLLMLLECSNVGATVDPLAVPRPDAVALDRWMTLFPSFGFLLAVREENLAAAIDRFAAREIAAAAIGRVTAGAEIVLHHEGETAPFWQLAESPLIGCAPTATEVAHA